MKTKNIIFLSLSIAVIIVVVFAFGLNQTQIISSTFINPDWARLECAPTDSLEGMQTFNSMEDNQIITCGIAENTEECRLTVINTGGSWFSFGTVSFKLNGISYTMQSDTHEITLFMDAGDSWKYEYRLAGSSDDVKIVKEWKPWKLYRFVGGAKWIVNSENCDIASNKKNKIREEDYPGSKLYRQGGEGTKWINYVNAWNYGPATNVFTHEDYGEVYCNAAQIF